MRRFFSNLNPTLRGFLVIALIAAIIAALQLESTLTALFLIAQVAFFLAIAFFVYLVWRERRSDIATWSRRGQLVFYGAAALLIVDLGAFFWPGRTTAGPDALAFLLVLALGAFSMWRVWRDENTYAV